MSWLVLGKMALLRRRSSDELWPRSYRTTHVTSQPDPADLSFVRSRPVRNRVTAPDLLGRRIGPPASLRVLTKVPETVSYESRARKKGGGPGGEYVPSWGFKGSMVVRIWEFVGCLSTAIGPCTFSLTRVCMHEYQ